MSTMSTACALGKQRGRRLYQYYLIDGIAVAEQRFNSSGVELYTLRYSLDENNSPVGFAIQYPSETAWTNYYFAKTSRET